MTRLRIQAAAAWTIALVLAFTHGETACAQASAADVPDAAKHLVLDSRAVQSTEGLRLVLGKVEKDPHNPLFQADKPWENALNNLYPNLIYDEEEKLFKLWYKCVLADKDVIAKMMPPETVHDVGWFLCYATSKDGIAWQKPELGLVGFDGSTKRNIVAGDDCHPTDGRGRGNAADQRRRGESHAPGGGTMSICSAGSAAGMYVVSIPSSLRTMLHPWAIALAL
jgi:hypothetical protein